MLKSVDPAAPVEARSRSNHGRAFSEALNIGIGGAARSSHRAFASMNSQRIPNIRVRVSDPVQDDAVGPAQVCWSNRGTRKPGTSSTRQNGLTYWAESNPVFTDDRAAS